MIVALASPRVATSLDDGLEKVRRLLAEASGNVLLPWYWKGPWPIPVTQ